MGASISIVRSGGGGGGGGNATVNLSATYAFAPAQAFVDFWENGVFPGVATVIMSPGVRATSVSPALCALYAAAYPSATVDFGNCELTLANMQAIGTACIDRSGTTLNFAGAHNANWPEEEGETNADIQALANAGLHGTYNSAFLGSATF